MKDLTILLPTLWRDQRLAALTKNILETTPRLHQLIFILWSEDFLSIDAVCSLLRLHPEIRMLVHNEKNINEGHNLAYRMVETDYFYPAQDDLIFTPRWFESTLPSFKNAQVVATWDRLGKMPSQGWVVWRGYIDQFSGVIDAPGKFLNDSYRHYFSDTEFTETAQYRGVYAVAETAFVDHANPAFDPRFSFDQTTEEARQHAEHDKALYNSRIHLFRGRGAL